MLRYKGGVPIFCQVSTPRTDDLYDLYDMHDLFPLYDVGIGRLGSSSRL